ncbi:HD domain-containing protein [bacterium]|nr:HD domain-containing protein [bacterium]
MQNSLEPIFADSSQAEKRTVLIVDDEENNLQLLKRTLRGKYNIMTAHNGQEGLDLVKQDGDNIALIVSDQKMPVMEGTEFLKEVEKIHPEIIKILLTGHVDTEILVSSINDCNLFQYILKPFEPADLQVSVENGIEKYNLSISKRLMLRDLSELFYKTLKSISCALDAKDAYTNGHSLRVTLYSLMLAKELNLDNRTMESIETAGLLHDIGKIGIPQSVLCKNGKLTDEEFAIMKSHPEKGEKIIMNIEKLKIVSNWLKSHHERWDGRGYPQGLAGEDIPLSARIIAIADTYDAMTSTRPYRTALSHEVAIAEIQKCAGSQFDPKLAEKFIAIQDEINNARQNVEEYYNRYSYLHQYLDSFHTASALAS